jgi:hypothetical protein
VIIEKKSVDSFRSKDQQTLKRFIEVFAKSILLPISSLKNASKCSFTTVKCAFSAFFALILFVLIAFTKASHNHYEEF